MAFFVVAGQTTRTNAALVAAHRRLGIDAATRRPNEIARHARPGDSVLVRLDVCPSLDGVEPGLWKLDALENGVEVLNRPGPLLAAHDKLATAIALAQHGVPHPRTAQVGEDETWLGIEPPVVVKPRFGSWGKDVFLCGGEEELEACLRRVRRRRWFRRHGALVQELVPPRGRDVRLVVARDELVGAIERVAAPGEWRTNISLGGRRRPVDPPPEAAAIALRAAAAVGCDLVGVDLLPLPDGGWTVIELNAAVELTAEYALDGQDVHERMALLLANGHRPARRRVTPWPVAACLPA
jgi:[lysine-biosynthesis-protein LysW]--L-2-aminoadipate ligase